MSKIFSKIKRRKISAAIIKSALFGFGIGTAAFAIPFAILKLTRSEYQLFILILIATLAALVAGAIFFLLTARSTMRLARAIDRKFALHEKVQTMIVYQKEDATMYQLQRDDATVALQGVYRKASKERGIGACITAALLGIALTVSAIIVQPPKEPDPPVITVPFEITDTQIKALEELTKRVRASGMYEPYRENVAVAIETMTDELKLATTTEERDESVNRTLIEILKQTDDSSAACELITSLWDMESISAKQLAKALNYYDSTVYNKYEEFLSSFEYSSDKPPAEVTEQEKLEALKKALNECAESIRLAITGSLISHENILCKELDAIAPSSLDPVPVVATENDGYNLSSLAQVSDIIGYERTLEELEILFAAVTPKLESAMNEHKINTDTGEGAVTQICSLFGLARPAFERPYLYESSTGGDTSDGPGMGGIGNGTVYGSDDLVYDPYSNTFVEYGTILDKYYELMFNKTLGDKYTKEEKDALEKYFAILYNGFDNTEKE